jgi:hypothetical protein
LDVRRHAVAVPEPGQESYLGDGLYVSHDGFQVQLRADGEDHMNVVYLEPSVLAGFEAWLKRLGR